MKRLLGLMLLALVGSMANATDIPILLALHGSNTVGQRLAPALSIAWAQANGWEVAADEVPVENERVIHLRRDTESALITISAHGTSTGLGALQNHRADLWMASRAATPGEVKASESGIGRLDDPTQEHIIALDGLAIIVHPDNPLHALTLDQIHAIFVGAVDNWSSLGLAAGQISLYARDDQSGTFDTFKSLVLQGASLSKQAARFESTEALAARVASDPGGIGFVGLAGVGKARAVAVADRETRAMLPDPLSIATEDYALSRRLFLYSTRAPREAVKLFIEFAQSNAGQSVVDKIGFVGQGVQLRQAETRFAINNEYGQLISGAERLSVNLRFGNGRSYLDSKATRDLDRIAAFLRGFPRGEKEIILIGFSDRREHNPVWAVQMSNDRADYVAGELARRGVSVHRARGLGQSVAVAANDSEAGRSKNRRVEIWVKPSEQMIPRNADSGVSRRRAASPSR